MPSIQRKVVNCWVFIHLFSRLEEGRVPLLLVLLMCHFIGWILRLWHDWVLVGELIPLLRRWSLWWIWWLVSWIFKFIHFRLFYFWNRLFWIIHLIWNESWIIIRNLLLKILRDRRHLWERLRKSIWLRSRVRRHLIDILLVQPCSSLVFPLLLLHILSIRVIWLILDHRLGLGVTTP